MAKSLYIIRHPSHTNRYHISEREAGFDFFISFALGAGCCIRAHKDREGAKAIIVAAGFAESLMSFDMKGTLFDSFSQSSFPIPLPTSVHEISSKFQYQNLYFPYNVILSGRCCPQTQTRFPQPHRKNLLIYWFLISAVLELLASCQLFSCHYIAMIKMCK